MTVPVQTLLAQEGWVRDLARRLVRDPHLADDLAQEAYLAALEDPTPGYRSLRSWLATVLRNRLRERLRREERRTARERAAARDDRAPSTLELVERVSIHQEVVEAVMGLPEHYRATLLLRYYEGLTPTAIAAAQGVPVSTVKTRLARGLALMRERLDERHGGDRRAWVVALLPLARAERGTLATLAGPAAVAALILVPAVVLIYLGLRPGAPDAAPGASPATRLAASPAPGAAGATGT